MGHFRLASHDREVADEELTPIICSARPLCQIECVTEGQCVQKKTPRSTFLFATNVAEIATGVPDRIRLRCSEISPLMSSSVFSLVIALRLVLFSFMPIPLICPCICC